MNLRLAPAQIALIALCLSMGALFVYEFTAAPAAFALPDVHLKPKALAMDIPAPFIAPPAGAFDAVNERPLFLPSRKPIATPAAAGGPATAGPPPLPSVALVGVIMDGQNSLAMVKVSGAPFEQAMGIGTAIGQWQIATIAPDHIGLRSGAYTQDVKIDARAGAPPPTATPGPGGTPQ